MRNRIETTTSLGRISEEIKKEHKGFLEWNSVSTRHDHQSILQVVIAFTRLFFSILLQNQNISTLFFSIFIFDSSSTNLI